MPIALLDNAALTRGRPCPPKTDSFVRVLRGQGLWPLAQGGVLKNDYGVWNTLNLDGGGSTTMAMGKEK